MTFGHLWLAILDFLKFHFSCAFLLLWFQQRLFSPSGQAQKIDIAERNKAGNFRSTKKQILYVKLLRQIRTPANRTKLLPLPLLSYTFQEEGALHYSVFTQKEERSSIWVVCSRHVKLHWGRGILLNSLIKLPKHEPISFSQFSFIAIKQVPPFLGPDQHFPSSCWSKHSAREQHPSESPSPTSLSH